MEQGFTGKSEGAQIADTLQTAYRTVGLVPHEKKAFRDKVAGDFWGININGDSCILRGALRRAIPLAHLLLSVAELGYSSVELLQILAGSAVSLFLFRRRLLCTLDYIFQACKNRRGCDIVRLSGRLKSELLIIACVLPFACTNLRAVVSPRITATDASTWWEASVCCDIPRPIAEELVRHSLRKSIWCRLLPPGKAWDRARGLLPASAELPDAEDELEMNPLWEVLCTALAFKPFLVDKSKSSRRINIGELRAFLAAERELGFSAPSSRELFGLDSQVVLGLLSKGRSASSSLNVELSRSVASVIGFDLYSEMFYFESSRNPADDPTRGRTLRAASRGLPGWWFALAVGDAEPFDAWLVEVGLDAHALSGLPDYAELGHSVQTVPSSCFPPLDSDKTEDKTLCFGQDVGKVDVGLGPPTPTEPRVFHGAFGDLTGDDADFVFEFLASSEPLQRHYKETGTWPPDHAGYLDLFSGEKGVAKAWVAETGLWAITFEIEDGPTQDLNEVSNRKTLTKLLALGAFLAWGAAPVCSSFSVAITPPVRTSLHPEGLDGVSSRMKLKILEGNSQSSWILELVVLSALLDLTFWVENPDLSWLFRQPNWVDFLSPYGGWDCGFWRFDQCRFYRKWRKRTRVLTSTGLAGTSTFCAGCKEHILLRGRSAKHKCSWTRVAQSYPRLLCKTLAYAVALHCGVLESTGGFDGSSFARISHRRIGEAKNPGPRGNRDLNLDTVPLVEAKTQALQSKVWQWFLQWVRSEVSGGAMESLLSEPASFSCLVKQFGAHLFASNKSQYVFRHLVVYIQKTMVSVRPFLSSSWELLQKWERVEPVTHRTPVPSNILRAMVVLALHWNWGLFACAIASSFYGILRPGEFLKLRRSDVLLPSDIHTENAGKVFLKIGEPKTRFRGRGRVQHATVQDPFTVKLLERFLSSMKYNQLVYPISPSSFRRRWDRILSHIGVPAKLKLTPGSLRSGGAIAEYRKGEDLSRLLWRMRLRHLITLENYVQEMAAENFSSKLSASVRHRIFILSEMFEPTLSVIAP